MQIPTADAPRKYRVSDAKGDIQNDAAEPEAIRGDRA